MLRFCSWKNAKHVPRYPNSATKYCMLPHMHLDEALGALDPSDLPDIQWRSGIRKVYLRTIEAPYAAEECYLATNDNDTYLSRRYISASPAERYHVSFSWPDNLTTSGRSSNMDSESFCELSPQARAFSTVLTAFVRQLHRQWCYHWRHCRFHD